MSEENEEHYIGLKGYTLYKKLLSKKEIHFIKESLFVKPNMSISGIQNVEGFPIYRESNKKLYIPRFFGIDNFGIPNISKISNGLNIDLKFNGSLRDYQEIIIDKYLNHVNHNFGGGGLLDIAPGRGKTVMALKIIEKLKVKTLVVVHKSFLLNQWIERIEQFLPHAKVGKIQGEVIDIDDKDIVIGMLQSLSMKDYYNGIFQDFGLTIYDEVHHLSAQVFSQTMMKVVTKYTLGLSGTMTRKDGLTKVFKMFLGNVFHKEIQKGNNNVNVRLYNYIVNDDDFNEMVYDYRGNPQYSTMISKLCNYNRRSEYILDILEETLKENEEQQILILGHNRCLLTYLYDAIKNRNISTVGYYLGGMKEIDLKESENKKVIIATYSMASEGLDIKTLTTLIMATPKTDICQSVGRILRTNKHQPLIIDIVDQHKIFKNQYSKRRSYYNKNNYNIIQKSKSKTTNIEDNIEDNIVDNGDCEVKIEIQNNKKCLINIYE